MRTKAAWLRPGRFDGWAGAAVIGAGAATALGLVTLLPASAGSDAVPAAERREVLAATCASHLRRAGFEPLPANVLTERFATAEPDVPAVVSLRDRCVPRS